VVSKVTGFRGRGWGCDSYKDTEWSDGGPVVLVPSCVPDEFGNGPYRPSPVPYVPTLFDRMDQGGVSWKVYEGAYTFSVCPTFYGCLKSEQSANLLPSSRFVAEASSGNLPAVSLVMPQPGKTQHNGPSMLIGDNWVGAAADAVLTGPDAATSVVFVTYDDCGCFYDHVPPPNASWGIRVPMVIASPFARPGFTDSNDATYASLLAFVEETFGLAPLNEADASAYDYADAFDFTQTPIAPPAFTTSRIPLEEREWLRQNPLDEDDPT
jgi:phospholipase C